MEVEKYFAVNFGKTAHFSKEYLDMDENVEMHLDLGEKEYSVKKKNFEGVENFVDLIAFAA